MSYVLYDGAEEQRGDVKDLTRDPYACCADLMELARLEFIRLELEVSIHDTVRKKECLRRQVELCRNLNHPVDHLRTVLRRDGVSGKTSYDVKVLLILEKYAVELIRRVRKGTEGFVVGCRFIDRKI